MDGQLNKQEAEALYERVRKYIEHENTLMSNRITWLITIQSFLFAVFGLNLQTAVNVLSEFRWDNPVAGVSVMVGVTTLDLFSLTLAYAGVRVSRVAYNSIRSARYSLASLRAIWDHYVERGSGDLVTVIKPERIAAEFRGLAGEVTQPLFGVIPYVSGGGFQPAYQFRGKEGSANIPLTMIHVWRFLAAVTIVKMAAQAILLTSPNLLQTYVGLPGA